MSRRASTQNSSRYCQTAARFGRRQRRSARTNTRRRGGGAASGVGGPAGVADIVAAIMPHGGNYALGDGELFSPTTVAGGFGSRGVHRSEAAMPDRASATLSGFPI